MVCSVTGIYLLLEEVVPDDFANHSVFPGHNTSLSPLEMASKYFRLDS